MSKKLVEVRVLEREERLVERAYYVRAGDDELADLEAAVKASALAPYAADGKCLTIATRSVSSAVVAVHGLRVLDQHGIPETMVIG